MICCFCGNIVCVPCECPNCNNIYCYNCIPLVHYCNIDNKTKEIYNNQFKNINIHYLEDEEIYCLNRKYGCLAYFKIKDYQKHHYKDCKFIVNYFNYYQIDGTSNFILNDYLVQE